jgi:hypothetical protein
LKLKSENGKKIKIKFGFLEKICMIIRFFVIFELGELDTKSQKDIPGWYF